MIRPRSLTLEVCLPMDGATFFRVASGLCKARSEGSVEPFVLVVEEAESIEAETLRRVAAEGRKLGVALCLVPQHPTEISRALGRC